MVQKTMNEIDLQFANNALYFMVFGYGENDNPCSDSLVPTNTLHVLYICK